MHQEVLYTVTLAGEDLTEEQLKHVALGRSPVGHTGCLVGSTCCDHGEVEVGMRLITLRGKKNNVDVDCRTTY